MKNCIENIKNFKGDSKEGIKVFECFYYIGVEMVDLYTLVLILNDKANKNLFIYEGALRSSKVIGFLVTHCGYTIEDVSLTKSMNCIEFLDKPNVKMCMESIKNVEYEPLVKKMIEDNLKMIIPI